MNGLIPNEHSDENLMGFLSEIKHGFSGAPPARQARAWAEPHS